MIETVEKAVCKSFQPRQGILISSPNNVRFRRQSKACILDSVWKHFIREHLNDVDTTGCEPVVSEARWLECKSTVGGSSVIFVCSNRIKCYSGRYERCCSLNHGLGRRKCTQHPQLGPEARAGCEARFSNWHILQHWQERRAMAVIRQLCIGIVVILGKRVAIVVKLRGSWCGDGVQK